MRCPQAREPRPPSRAKCQPYRPSSCRLPPSDPCNATCNVTRHATMSRWAGREFTTRRPGQPFVRWQSSSSPKAERQLSRCVPSRRGRARAREPSTACSGRATGFSSTRWRRTAYTFLADGMDNMAETDDPAADLVENGVTVYRRLVLEHPALYRIAFQRIVPDFRADPARSADARSPARQGPAVADAGQLADAGRDGGRLHRRCARVRDVAARPRCGLAGRCTRAARVLLERR